MNKRGIEMSFGMIFSIIIIVATIAIAGYVIVNFLDLKKCTDIGFFYNDLNDFVQEAWQEDIARRTFSRELPAGIEAVCFGNTSMGSGVEFDSVKRYGRGNNMFFYPPEKACNNPAFNIEHLSSEWKCYAEQNGKVAIRFEKESFDNFVRIV